MAATGTKSMPFIPSHSDTAPGILGLFALLASRLILFALIQGLIALTFLALGSTRAWQASEAWVPVVVTLTNGISLHILIRLLRREGLTLRYLYAGNRQHILRDILTVIGVTLISGLLVILPNYGIATALFGDAMIPVGMMFQPLPLWVVYLFMILFPVTVALAELPTYMGYVMPRLGARLRSPWAAVLLCGFFFALQHGALPLIMDWRFIVWRVGMYLPFAVFLAVVLRWRPRLLPYVMVVHGLLDLQAMFTLLSYSV